jgi:hypothetical protein
MSITRAEGSVRRPRRPAPRAQRAQLFAAPGSLIARGWRTRHAARSASTLAGRRPGRAAPFSRRAASRPRRRRGRRRAARRGTGSAKAPLPRKTTRTSPHSSQSSVRAFLRSLRFMRSRLSGVSRSTKSRPSMWSISWQNARARSSVPVVVRSLPSGRAPSHARAPGARASRRSRARTGSPRPCRCSPSLRRTRVHELDELALVLADGEVDDRSRAAAPRSGRGQADAGRRVHRLHHVVEQLWMAPSISARARRAVQHGVAVLHDGS